MVPPRAGGGDGAPGAVVRVPVACRGGRGGRGPSSRQRPPRSNAVELRRARGYPGAVPELQQLRSDHAPRVLAFELANRAYFAASISDRGDAYFDRFPERFRAMLAEQETGRVAYYVLVDEDGSVIGRFNLRDIDEGAAEVGYRVAERSAGRGVATAAVEELCRLAVSRHGLRTLRARTTHENVASQRVLTKAGFTPDGAADAGGRAGRWHVRVLHAADPSARPRRPPEGSRRCAANRPRIPVTLRTLSDADLDVLFNWEKDRRAVEMAAFTRADPSDRAAFDAHKTRIPDDPSTILLAIDADGVFVGTIGSFEMEGEREVTYWISPERWGEGLASAALVAFLTIESTRPLVGRVAEHNVASAKVLVRAGFVEVGSDTSFAAGLGTAVIERIYRLDR